MEIIRRQSRTLSGVTPNDPTWDAQRRLPALLIGWQSTPSQETVGPRFFGDTGFRRVLDTWCPKPLPPVPLPSQRIKPILAPGGGPSGWICRGFLKATASTLRSGASRTIKTPISPLAAYIGRCGSPSATAWPTTAFQ